MYYANDTYIGRSLRLYGEYSEGEIALWSQFLRPGMTVIDVGANIGAHTIYLAKAVGPRGLVYAIEPQRQLYQMLVGNLALNEIANTSVFMGALADDSYGGAKRWAKTDEGTGTIKVPPIDYGSAGNFGATELGKRSKKGEAVPVVTLDSLGLNRVRFIKIDVEGMECAVLRGASETLSRDRPILYVENDRAEHSRELISLILGARYRLFWHLPPLFNPKNFSGAMRNIFPNVVSGNMLGVHKTTALKIRGLREITSPDDQSGVCPGPSGRKKPRCPRGR
jgi:FkbM family methyltransferase